MNPGRFLGILLMWISGLWLLLSGGCTIFFLSMGLDPRVTVETQAYANAVTILALIAGAIGIIPGLVVFFIGRAISRRPEPPTPDPLEGAPPSV